MNPEALVGIDFGGTWIKAAEVRLATGGWLGEPVLRETPRPATPAAVAEVVASMVGELGVGGRVGITMPCVVEKGIARSAAHIDDAWVDEDAAAILSDALGGRPVTVINDADAAGIAEVEHGAAKGYAGTVVVLTFGTGIGSALLHDGRLVPNSELGHYLWLPNGRTAEEHIGPSVRRGTTFDWDTWCERVNEYLAVVENVFRPEHIVIGGGVSVASDVARWEERLHPRAASLRPAQLRNYAGVVGAAMAAAAGL